MKTRVTRSAVNDALAKEFGEGRITLHHGKGYYYFAGPGTDRWSETVLNGDPHLSAFRVNEIVAVARKRTRAALALPSE